MTITTDACPVGGMIEREAAIAAVLSDARLLTRDGIVALIRALPAAQPAQRVASRVEYSDGALDEVVTDAGMHLERMSKKGWFLTGLRSDGTEIAIWFRGKVTLVEERDWNAYAAGGPITGAEPAAQDGGEVERLQAERDALRAEVEALRGVIAARCTFCNGTGVRGGSGGTGGAQTTLWHCDHGLAALRAQQAGEDK